MLYQYEVRGTGRLHVRFTENFEAEIHLCSADCNHKNALPKLWKKNGYIDKETFDSIKKFGWLCVDTYYKDDKGWWGRYNPTITDDHKIDFETLRHISITNIFDLLNEVYNCYATECEAALPPIITNKTLLEVEHELDCFIENYCHRFNENFSRTEADELKTVVMNFMTA